MLFPTDSTSHPRLAATGTVFFSSEGSESPSYGSASEDKSPETSLLLSGVGMPPLFLLEHNRVEEAGATIPQIDDGPLRRSKHLSNPEDKNERPAIRLIP